MNPTYKPSMDRYLIDPWVLAAHGQHHREPWVREYCAQCTGKPACGAMGNSGLKCILVKDHEDCRVAHKWETVGEYNARLQSSKTSTISVEQRDPGMTNPWHFSHHEWVTLFCPECTGKERCEARDASGTQCFLVDEHERDHALAHLFVGRGPECTNLRWSERTDAKPILSPEIRTEIRTPELQHEQHEHNAEFHNGLKKCPACDGIGSRAYSGLTERCDICCGHGTVAEEKTSSKLQEEAVNHPSHYGGDTVYEHVKVATAWGLLQNAFLYNCTKYLCRAGKKGDALEDLRKARWYLEREIERVSGKKDE